ncbi:Hypothetical predicted protein, partial [Pelobates cultripes]
VWILWCGFARLLPLHWENAAFHTFYVGVGVRSVPHLPHHIEGVECSVLPVQWEKAHKPTPEDFYPPSKGVYKQDGAR